MTEEFLLWLQSLIAAGDLHPFYITKRWRHKRDEVWALDRYECVHCKARGKYKRAQLVHHVNRVERAPQLALDIWYTTPKGTTERNLLSVCRECHETVCHPERMRKHNYTKKFTTPERWD